MFIAVAECNILSFIDIQCSPWQYAAESLMDIVSDTIGQLRLINSAVSFLHASCSLAVQILSLGLA